MTRVPAADAKSGGVQGLLRHLATSRMLVLAVGLAIVHEVLAALLDHLDVGSWLLSGGPGAFLILPVFLVLISVRIVLWFIAPGFVIASLMKRLLRW